jgi:hypothetical protein
MINFLYMSLVDDVASAGNVEGKRAIIDGISASSALDIEI